MIAPSKAEFLERAGHASKAQPTQLVTLSQELLADVETPLSAYWKLAHDETHSFLLESVAGSEQVGRYSALGVRPRVVLRSKNGQVTRLEGGVTTESHLNEGQDPLDLLKAEVDQAQTQPDPSLRTFTGGAVGMLGYDIVRYFEKLPDANPDDLEVDDLAMMLTSTVVLFDHARNRIRVVAQSEPTEKGYEDARCEIERVVTRLQAPLPGLPSGKYPIQEVQVNQPQTQFESMVEKMVEYIVAGDAFQVVPSQRFSTPVQAHPLTLYRALRTINPSPYMFLLRFGDFDHIGASPELQVSLHGGIAHTRPIAGTRPRGIDDAEDAKLASELLADEKERSEHVMLVDLARNDIGRVCEFGTVQVNDLMVIERYSHVMHIVSDVTGKLRADLDAYDLIRATFPLGTVSGAPKIRAMEIIDELEPTRRGFYAGAVGYVSYTGETDTCVALRTIFLKDGIAYVQAGGGVVVDSSPTFEYNESRNKSRSSLRSIELAQNNLELT
jgi:anthranilate synthase component 1